MDRYALLYLKWITHKDLLYSTGNSVQCYVSAWFGGEWIHVYIGLSLFTGHLKCTTLLIGSTPVENKNFKNKINKKEDASIHGVEGRKWLKWRGALE